MNIRRAWVCVFLFTLTLINYTDRVALSVAAKPISSEFHLSPVEMGYLLSSFLWTYELRLIPVGLLVDRFGGKAVNAGGIALWSPGDRFLRVYHRLLVLWPPPAWSWAWANPRAGRHPTALSVNGFRQPNAAWRTPSSEQEEQQVQPWAPWSSPQLSARSAGAPAFSSPASIGLIWLMAWLIVFDKPEQVRWLRPAERDKILAERDGERPETRAQPASSLWRLLTSSHRVGIVPDTGLRSLRRRHAADLAPDIPAERQRDLSACSMPEWLAPCHSVQQWSWRSCLAGSATAC